MKRSYIKRKSKPLSKIRKAARGEECTIMIPHGLPHNPETTVLCHSNSHKDGKGMGLKASDESGAFGCLHCHDIIDRRRKPPEGMTHNDCLEYFRRGNERTLEILKRKGLI